MRFLKTKEYRLIEANDLPSPCPLYAILSHTWISPRDEITYQDFKQRKGDMENSTFKRRGWEKLKKYCDRAARDGWEWAWMDTCCIDKTNPADTQEAINAMFRWYQDAGICYAYLEDVDIDKILHPSDLTDVEFTIDLDLDDIASRNNVANPTSFPHKAINPFLKKAKWFTRGWTLQELLAPPYLVFVDQAWRRIGTRESWAVEIKEASRIDAQYLINFDPTDFTACSIAMRLSWASCRETTVEEDETYSLLGLFGVSLPLIYGEGRWRAFNRLQRELINTVRNDDSIFAWKARPSLNNSFPGPQWKGEILLMDQHSNTGELTALIDHTHGWGILAPSIREFWDASNVNAFGLYGNEFTISNQGLKINAKHWKRKGNSEMCLIRLNCGIRIGCHLGIPLKFVKDSYARVHVDELYDMNKFDYNDWEEESVSITICIRAGNFSQRRISASIFTLEYPDRIRVGGKYFLDYRTSGVDIDTKLQRLEEGVSGLCLKKNELVVEPDQLVFINIELRVDQSTSQFDIIVNLTANGFPSVGILARDQEPWTRLGDPLDEALGIYEHLADHLHYKAPTEPAFPIIAVDDMKNLVIGICLLPRPPLRRSTEKVTLGTVREYVLQVTVQTDDHLERDMSRLYSKRRRLG